MRVGQHPSCQRFLRGAAPPRAPMSRMSTPGYRDEHTALLARQAALEAEIAQLKAEAKGGPFPHPPAKKRASPLLWAVLLATVVGTTGFTATVLRRPSKRRSDPGPPHSVQASWQARVTNATGAANVKPGAACRIDARIDYRGQTVQAVHKTVISCEGTVLYSEAGAFASGNALEITYDATKKDGRYDFLLDEKGTRTRPHPYASIDTARGVGLISGEVPRMSVDLAIEPGSKEAHDDVPATATKR
ncbi:MAG: hypothetical protein K0S65_2799 [Labilithrix sp.]|nr:hypothetical protein [Labilithrix sp.]